MGAYRDLLERATQGDKNAVTELYNRYCHKIRKFSKVNGIHNEDLYQTLVIEFLHMVSKFRI